MGFIYDNCRGEGVTSIEDNVGKELVVAVVDVVIMDIEVGVVPDEMQLL
jgi:hypothetical protein